MNTNENPHQKKAYDVPHAPLRQKYTVPLPKDTDRCRGCPYPGVGFICWSTDGSCLRTEMDRTGRPGR